MSVLIVDQGSSSTKAALVGENGELLERVRLPVGTRREGDRVEQDAAELLESVRSALVRLVERASDVRAIGLCCQRSTCLLWDRATGRPRTPALSWQDVRTAPALGDWSAEDRETVARRTGLRLSPHYAGSKLRWLLDTNPGARAAAAAGKLVAGTLDAFLVRGLTGRESTEPGHAGRTLLYDLERDAWSPWLTERFAVPLAALPPLVPSRHERGRWEGIPVAALLGDQQAALLGSGGRDGTIGVVQFGTGAFVLARSGRRVVRHPGLLSAVIWSEPGRRELQIEGSVNSAGSALEWLAERLGIDLEAWAPEGIDPDAVPWCVPAFAGLGAPWWDPAARATISGLRTTHGAEDLLAGLLAGIVFRVVDNLEALVEGGVALRRLRIGGPVTRIAALGRLLADASGMEVESMAEPDVGLLGVAGLLGVTTVPATAGRWRPRWDEGRRRETRRAWRELVRSAGPGAFPDAPRSRTL